MNSINTVTVRQTASRKLDLIITLAFLLSLLFSLPAATANAQSDEPSDSPPTPQEENWASLDSLNNHLYLPYINSAATDNVPADVLEQVAADELGALATNVARCNERSNWLTGQRVWSGFYWNTVVSGCPNIYVNPSVSGYVQVAYYSNSRRQWVWKPYQWVSGRTWTEVGNNFSVGTSWYVRFYNISSMNWLQLKTTSGRLITSSPPPSSGLQIDWAFIEQQEGNLTTGYVPRDANGQPFGNSGVTIGSGFDLGQHDRAYMERIGIPNNLVNILAPYTGLKKWDAINFLAANPLSLSLSDTRIVNEKVKTDKAQGVINAYNNASSVPFTSLPKGAQTVIASVAFQYGYLPSATPRFWGHVTRQDWDATIAELRNFGDRYGPRRNREADYLAANR